MRTKQAPIRKTLPDPVYGSVPVSKLINCVMRDGKKTVAAKQVYIALSDLEKATGKDALVAFDEVLQLVSPQMEVRSRRIGGAAYQVPMPVRPIRSTALALRWLVEEANKRSSKDYHTFAEKLAAEMLDVLKNSGGAMERRATAHRMADANKAFAHFRW